MSDDEQVRAACGAFYEALHRVCNHDPEPMKHVWHHTERAATVHPMGSWVHGWEQVWATWQELAHVISNGTIRVLDLTIEVHGDVAIATCIEDVDLVLGGTPVQWRSNVTNVLSREGGHWKMIDHHADKAPSAEKAIDDFTA